MATIHIVSRERTPSGIRCTVASNMTADYLAEEARQAGFSNVTVRHQEADLFNVMIGVEPGGKVADIDAFLRNHPDVL